MRKLALALVIACALVAPPASAQTPLRTWCMDGLEGEVCFDVMTFQITGGDVFTGGTWRGSSYPLGQAPLMSIGFFNTWWSSVPLDASQSGTVRHDEWLHLGDRFIRYDDGSPLEPGQWVMGGQVMEDDYRQVTSLDDVSYVGLVWGDAPDRESIQCFTPGWEWTGYQRCAVSVPEPSALLLLATGGLGLAYIRRRRA